MHGMPPADFPRSEIVELNGLHNKLGMASEPERGAMEKRFSELDAKIRSWPRTIENDPYHAASHRMGKELSRVAGTPVLVGFNEYCAPDLHACFDQAAAQGAESVTVVTPMMTRGGSHSERDIPDVIESARKKYPKLSVQYAWPFEDAAIAEFLHRQIQKISVRAS